MCVLSRGKNVAREGKLRDGGNAGCYSQVVGPLLREWAGGPRSDTTGDTAYPYGTFYHVLIYCYGLPLGL